MTTSPAPRFYYDCPIKAAFMAQYHGMKFRMYPQDYYIDHKGRQIGYAFFTDPMGIIRTANGSFSDDWTQCWFIHPESISLLEPQIGDLYISTEDQIAFRLTGDLCKKWAVRPAGEIVQRGGKPFISPEREGA